jgi:RHS repeat-associated protein
MTDASGAIVEETAFYPFGIPRHEHRLRQVEEPYKFTQKERDPESGLHYFEARFLTGTMSRFLSVDPMYANTDSSQGDPQALNLYAYVRNNPLQYTDPTGLQPAPDAAAIGRLALQAATNSDAAKSDAASFSAGIGDSLLDTFTPYPWIYEGVFGGNRIGPDIRGALGIENVDTDSGYYGGGEIVGTVLTFATGAGELKAALKGGTTAAKALSKGGSVVDPLAKTQIGGPFAKTIVPAAKGSVTVAESMSTAGPKLVPQVISPKTQWIQGMGNQTQAGRQAMWPFQSPLQRQESLSVIFDFAVTLFKGPK